MGRAQQYSVLSNNLCLARLSCLNPLCVYIPQPELHLYFAFSMVHKIDCFNRRAHRKHRDKSQLIFTKTQRISTYLTF